VQNARSEGGGEPGIRRTRRIDVKKLLERSRYLVVIAVVASLVAAVAAFGWGAVKTVLIIVHLVTERDQGHEMSIAFIQLMDAFLIATGLVIFALGLYELFVEALDLPEWLRLHDLHDLKTRLSSIIILVMVVAFLEHLVEWRTAQDTILFGGAVALVSAILIVFPRAADKR
jgi:uncharacterized membrane protein YqhA